MARPIIGLQSLQLITEFILLFLLLMLELDQSVVISMAVGIVPTGVAGGRLIPFGRCHSFKRIDPAD